MNRIIEDSLQHEMEALYKNLNKKTGWPAIAGREKIQMQHKTFILQENHQSDISETNFNPYPTAFPYGNGMVLHFYQQQESSTTKTVHKVINRGHKTYV